MFSDEQEKKTVVKQIDFYFIFITIFMYRYLIKVIKQHVQRVLEYHTKSEEKNTMLHVSD